MKKTLLATIFLNLLLLPNANAFADQSGLAVCFEFVESDYYCGSRDEKINSAACRDLYSQKPQNYISQNKADNLNEDDSEDEDAVEVNSESLDDLSRKLKGQTREKVIEMKGEPDRTINGILFYETECHDPGTKKKYEKFVVIFDSRGKCLRIDGYDEIKP